MATVGAAEVAQPHDTAFRHQFRVVPRDFGTRQDMSAIFTASEHDPSIVEGQGTIAVARAT
jgi:hypothetical protein